MNRYRIIVAQIVTDDALGADDRRRKPAGRYLYIAGDPGQALDRFREQIPIACVDDFSIEIEPFVEADTSR